MTKKVITCRYLRLKPNFSGKVKYQCVMGHKSTNEKPCPASCNNAKKEVRKSPAYLASHYPIINKFRKDTEK